MIIDLRLPVDILIPLCTNSSHSCGGGRLID